MFQACWFLHGSEVEVWHRLPQEVSRGSGCCIKVWRGVARVMDGNEGVVSPNIHPTKSEYPFLINQGEAAPVTGRLYIPLRRLDGDDPDVAILAGVGSNDSAHRPVSGGYQAVLLDQY